MIRSALLIVALVGLWSGSAAAAEPSINKDFFIDGEGWQVVGTGYKFTEGPAADAAGNVYFTDIPNNRIHKVDLEGKVTVFAEDTGATNGLMFGPDGRLYGCQNGRKRIVAYTLDGKAETLAENVESNDLVVNAAGDLYFTDPGNKQVWFLPKGGKPRVVAKGLSPNGVTLWPDQGTLVVTERDQPLLWTFRVEADGSLTEKDSYYAPLQIATGKTRPGSDGLKVDSAGRVYAATYAGVQVFDEFGRLIGTMLKPQAGSLSNVCFGGPNLDTLYVTAGDKVFKRKVKVKGIRYVPVIVEKK